MPESKKLSELISDLVLTYISRSKSENINDFEEKTFEVLAIKQRIDVYERTIDQKFEELRCITPGPVRNLDEMLKELVDKKFEELRCSCEKHKLKEWKESLSLFEQVMESKKKEYPLFEGKNEFYSSEENARKGIQEIKEILFRRGDEIQKRMLEIIYEGNSKKD